jgi:predicted flap endonuclease-1-like 5' DNA nuclease
MFGLDPFNPSVAVSEILLLLGLAAFIGWLLGRLVLAGRISALQTSIADKEAELADCRRAKATGRPVTVRSETVVETPPAFVHADPLLPILTNDDTPEFIDEDVTVPTVSSSLDVPPIVEIPPVGAPIPEVPAFIPPVPAQAQPVTDKADNSEAAVLNRIAARANEVNFDRIGRATATEADDLKDIVGVGPFLERKLHSLGIYTFRQVANFTKEDIDKVNELIEFFPGRIERDNWVEQANDFYNRKYGKKADG